MKITDARLQLFSQHKAETHHEQHQRLQIWRDGEAAREIQTPLSTAGLQALESQLKTEQPSLNLSSQAQAMQPKQALVPENAALSTNDELEVSILKLLIEHLTGHKLELFDPQQLEVHNTEAASEIPADQPSTSPQREGWGRVYDAYESRYEAESIQFTARGIVNTEDGKQIEIQLEMNLAREFYTEERLSIRAGDALKDPLVINFDGTAAQLTKTKFHFDLDRDGRQEQISFLQPGSGFLALDKNQDGRINDGGELFGPTSNDGFRELAAYDQDANGWIDQNDAVYERLRIWSKDSDGNDRLVALGQRGVGALYLGHIATPFKLTDHQNTLLGQTRETGLYLVEDGSVGTLQQVDLVT